MPMGKPHSFEAPCGPITAYESGGLIRAKGIPYATAKRFHAPEPCQTWTTPFDASKPSPYCPQDQDALGESLIGAELLAGLTADENCQCLSVTLPTSYSLSSKLPVFVWIHGGNYLYGAGDAKSDDPSKLVQEQNIVAVTITYRVGLFGYIGDGEARPANLGLLDQIAALRWVKKNIGSLGGDPENVTVAGHSAGGDAVVHLLACDEAPNLFRRAVIESAPLGIRVGRKEMLAAMVKRTRHINGESSTEDVVNASKDAMSYARRFGAKAGMALATQYGQPPLPEEDKLEDAWKRNASKVDILIGTARDELSAMTEAVPALKAVFGVPWVGEKMQASVVGYWTRKVYTDETTRLAHLFADAGANVWQYELSFAPPGNKLGASHPIILHLQFGSEAVWKNSKFVKGMPWSEVESAAVRLRKLLADFVRGSDLKDRGDIPGLLSYDRVTATG